jgi:hypothetical protein
MKNEPACAVADVQGDRVVVRFATTEGLAMLSQLGGTKWKGKNDWAYNCSGDTALASLLGKLRDLGVPFQGGESRWPPASVFERLRAKGLLQGNFVETVFGGPKAGWAYRTR